MNHLAHFHLAGGVEPLVVGALLGDFVKGPLDARMDRAHADGVRLHRRVDAFMDTHPLPLGLRRSFPPGERRLAGIVLDVWFDHLLARHWSRFHHAELGNFSAGIYATLERNRAHLPPEALRRARGMAEHDVLGRYAEVPLVEGVLERIGERLGMREAMDAACRRARTHAGNWEPVFLAYYTEAVAMARAQRCTMNEVNSRSVTPST